MPKSNAKDIYIVSYEEFSERVIDASQQRPVLVDLWAEWCPPCLAIAPILEKIVRGSAGDIALAKLEVDVGENMKIAGQYKVRGFPTIILFQNGEERGRFSGTRSKSFVEDFIEQHRLD